MGGGRGKKRPSQHFFRLAEFVESSADGRSARARADWRAKFRLRLKIFRVHKPRPVISARARARGDFCSGFDFFLSRSSRSFSSLAFEKENINEGLLDFGDYRGMEKGSSHWQEESYKVITLSRIAAFEAHWRYITFVCK